MSGFILDTIMSNSFDVKDSNLSLRTTGEIAASLLEFKDLLYQIPISSLYYHFWGRRLRISFIHPEYHNDFAEWAHFGLHDEILAERLTIIDPTEYPDCEQLRKQVIDVIEDRLEEIEYILWSRKEYKFHFLQSILIVYDLGIKITSPVELKNIISKLPLTSIFYHFIDARARTVDGSDDFSFWLLGFDNKFTDLIKKIKLIDPYFLLLSEIKQKLTELFNEHL